MRSFAFAAIVAVATAAEEQENLYHSYGYGPHYGGVYGAHYGDHAVYTPEHADYGVEPWESRVPIHAVHEEVAHVGPVLHEEHHYAAPYHYSDGFYHAPVAEYHTTAYHAPYYHGMPHFAAAPHLERHYEGYHVPAHHKSTYYIPPEHTAYEISHPVGVHYGMPHATTTTTTTTYGDDYGYGHHPYAAYADHNVDTFHSTEVVEPHLYGDYGVSHAYGDAYVAPVHHEIHDTYVAPVHDTYVDYGHLPHDTYVDHEIGLHDTVATHDIHDLHKTYTYGAGLRDTFIADHEPHAFGATTTTTYGDHGYYGGEHHVYEDVHDLHYEPYQHHEKSKHDKPKEAATPVLGLDAAKPEKKAKKDAKKNESDENVW